MESLNDKEAIQYKGITLSEFMDERFTDRLSKIAPNLDYNKIDKKTGSVTLQVLSYHADRPHEDLSKFCSINGGQLILASKGKEIKYRSLAEIERDSKDVYIDAKHSSPSEITIDTGLGIQTTYHINETDYAANKANSYYQNEIRNKIKFENSDIAKQYNAGNLGTFMCKKDNKFLWGVDISYQGEEKDGNTLWYMINIKPIN